MQNNGNLLHYSVNLFPKYVGLLQKSFGVGLANVGDELERLSLSAIASVGRVFHGRIMTVVKIVDNIIEEIV